MVLYTCKYCDYTTSIKTHYIRHQSTKKHLRNVSNNEQFEKESNIVSLNEEKNVLKMFYKVL